MSAQPGPAESPSLDPVRDVARTPSGRIGYTLAGTGEPLLLIHGLGATGETWRKVLPSLATAYTVIVPDLPGHGRSGPPAGDYSLGAHATALRDLVVALGHDRVTVVGHSLGGGVGMQFAYQFPERTARLLLVNSGGLGPELSPLLSAATLPGAQAVVGVLGALPEPVTRLLLAGLSVPGLVAAEDIGPVAAGIRGMGVAEQRRSFLRTARTVITWRGQSVSAARRLGLLTELPVMVMWGGRDRFIPPRHFEAIVAQLPDAHVVEIPEAGHCPQETAPERVVAAMHSFLAATEPFVCDEKRWRQLMAAPATVTLSRRR